LRRQGADRPEYREIQVKYGKLHPCRTKWELALFDVTSWRFFKADEFAAQKNRKDFFIVYVLAEDIGYNRDIFIWPAPGLDDTRLS
jgi:hypothetical protein